MEKVTSSSSKKWCGMQRWITLSTVVTLSRLILIPVIVRSIIMKKWIAALSFFGVAALTDVIDGALARWMDEETEIGALLDPLVDKLFILSCLATLFFVHGPSIGLPLWFVLIVLSKEILLILCSFYFYKRYALAIAPTQLGKYTACMQMLFIMYLLCIELMGVDGPWVLPLTQMLLVVISVLTVASLIHYGLIGFFWYINNKSGRI